MPRDEIPQSPSASRIGVEPTREPDGTYQLIEINPRFPAWVYLAAGSGRNVAEILLQTMGGEAPPDRGSAPAGFIYIRYAADAIIPLAEYESVVMNGWRLKDDTAREKQS